MIVFHRCLLPAALAGLLFAAQEADRPPSPQFRVTSDLVQFDVTVMDSRNRPVTDLQASDFSVTEDGKPQTITDFAYSSAGNGPRSIVFLLDTCEGTSLSGLVRDRQASFLSGFIDREVHPADSVAIMGTAEGEAYMYGPFSDRARLHEASRAVRLPARTELGCFGFEYEILKFVQIGSRDGGSAGAKKQPRNEGIASYQGIISAIDGLATAPGRRSLVVFSVFTGWSALRASSHEIDELVSRAKSAGVAVYVVYHDLRIRRPDPRSPIQLEDEPFVKTQRARLAGPARLAEETGGFVINAPSYSETGEIVRGMPMEEGNERLMAQRERLVDRHTAEFAASLERVAADLSGAYRIGFKPLADFRGDPKFHKVKFTVKRRGLKIHARNGYYGPPLPTPPEPETPQESLEAALRTPFRGRSIAMRLLPVHSAVKDPKSGNWRGVLRSVVSIHPADLVYEDAPGGAKRAEVEIKIVAFGDRDREVASVSRSCASTLKPAEFAGRASLRLFCNLDVPVPGPGIYMLRAAVLDGRSGKTGSAYAVAPLPDFAEAGKRYKEWSGDYNQSRIMVSGMLLGLAETGASAADGMYPAGANPVEREFPAGARLAYSFEAYGGTTDRKTGVPVFNGAAFVLSPRAVLPVADTGPMPIRADDPNRVHVTGKVSLNAGLGPGLYWIRVALTDERTLPPVSTKPRLPNEDPYGGSGTGLDTGKTDFTITPAPRQQ